MWMIISFKYRIIAILKGVNKLKKKNNFIYLFGKSLENKGKIN